MKFSNLPMKNLFYLLSLLGLIFCPVVAKSQKINISIAALSLPGSSSGELHWNCGDEYVTEPVQLSKRYFSKPIELKSNIVRFFEEPIVKRLPNAPLPQPLLTITLPPDTKEAFVVILAGGNSEGDESWRYLTLDGNDWDAGTLRVVNASKVELGMLYPGEKLKLQPGKHVDFKQDDWNEAFPIKIVQLEPVAKLVFSSTWRVSKGRREICFLSRKNGSGSISLHSLLVLN